MTGKFDLTNVNNMAFYISGPKLLFETTEISTHPNSTQQESNYIYSYTTKFGTSIKIRLNRKFESTEFETMRVNCILSCDSKNGIINLWYVLSILISKFLWQSILLTFVFRFPLFIRLPFDGSWTTWHFRFVLRKVCI